MIDSIDINQFKPRLDHGVQKLYFHMWFRTLIKMYQTFLKADSLGLWQGVLDSGHL